MKKLFATSLLAICSSAMAFDGYAIVEAENSKNSGVKLYVATQGTSRSVAESVAWDACVNEFGRSQCKLVTSGNASGGFVVTAGFKPTDNPKDMDNRYVWLIRQGTAQEIAEIAQEMCVKYFKKKCNNVTASPL